MSEQDCKPDMTPGIVSWNELMSSDAEASKTFYAQLFGWSTEEMPGAHGVYHVLKAGDRPAGGLIQLPPEAKGAPSMWMPYVTVANVKDALDKAKSLGATMRMDVTAVPQMGCFAVITDPQGATLGLWEFVK